MPLHADGRPWRDLGDRQRRAEADGARCAARRWPATSRTARALNDRLLPLHRTLFVEPNPIPVKWALAKMGLIANELRLPLVPLSPQFHDTVRTALREAGCL